MTPAPSLFRSFIALLALASLAHAAPPIANPDTVITRIQSGSLPLTDLVANDTDADGDPLRIFSVTQGEFGAVGFDSSDNSVVYLPSRSFAGADSFQYEVRDPAGNSASTTVTIRNPFLLGKGSYGTAIQDETPAHGTSGYLLLTLSFNGTFTAQVRFAGETFRVRGSFALDGTFTTQLAGEFGARTLTLDLPVDGGDPVISGSLAGVEFSVARNPFTAANPAPRRGAFTFILPPAQPDSKALPQGTGYGTLKITSSGSARVSGRLGDGQRFSSSVLLGEDGTLPFYAALYANPGSLFGSVTFTDDEGFTALSGDLTWFKPAQRDRFYPRGFTTTTALRGASYVAPEPSEYPLEVIARSTPNATFAARGDGLRAPRVARATILPRPSGGPYRVRFPRPSGLRAELTINATSGIFSGSFATSRPSLRLRFTGVLVQGGENLGAGVFLGATRTGQVSLTPD